MKHSMLKLKEVIAKTRLSRSGIYKRILDGEFPRQINLGPRNVVWLESEVNDWIKKKINER